MSSTSYTPLVAIAECEDAVPNLRGSQMRVRLFKGNGDGSLSTQSRFTLLPVCEYLGTTLSELKNTAEKVWNGAANETESAGALLPKDFPWEYYGLGCTDPVSEYFFSDTAEAIMAAALREYYKIDNNSLAFLSFGEKGKGYRRKFEPVSND